MDTRFRMFAACSMLKGCLLDACCLLELLFDVTADKMDGALRNLLILSSYSPQSNISIICDAVTTFGVLGKCFKLPVTRKESSSLNATS